MALPVTRSARRIAEPGLLAAMAAMLHMTDLLFTLGMMGSLLCPLPHMLSTYRYGLRTGGLTALAACGALLAFGGPVEAAYHMLIFAIPGVAAGAALAGRGTPGQVLVAGSAATTLGTAFSFFLLEQGAGIPDVFVQTRPVALAWLELASWPPRAGGFPPAWFDMVPGLASPEVRAAWYDALVRLPIGIFAATGTMVFCACWWVGGLLLLKLRESPRLARITAAPRLAWPLCAVLVATGVAPLAAHPGWACAQANAWFMAAAAAWVVGYLHLLRLSHGNPLRGLFSIVGSMGLYYVSIWFGVLSTLNPPGDPAAWAVPPPGAVPGREARRP